MDLLNKAICPQCGAQGTVGRFCEYCGTKIPEPVIESLSDNDGEFNWYTVCPHDYEPSFDSVIGDYSQSLYMVVKTEIIEENRRTGEKDSVKYYAIINREGKFITKKVRSFLKLFVDNYDYITFRELINIITKDSVKFEDRFSGFGCQMVGALMIAISSPRRVFNRKTRNFVQLDKIIPQSYKLQVEKSTDERIVLYDWEDGNKNADAPDRKCIITIADDKGIVTFDGKKNVRELPANVKIKEDGMCQIFDDVTVYKESKRRDFELFDRQNEANIYIYKGPNYDYTFIERNAEGHFVFSKTTGTKEYVCIVRLTNSNGRLKAETIREERELKWSIADYLGCIGIITFIILLVCGFFMFVMNF